MIIVYLLISAVFGFLIWLIPVPKEVRLPWYIEIPTCLVLGLLWPAWLPVLLGFFLLFLMFGL